MLSLCFVDPFDFGIKFDVIRKLSDFRVDFLVLLATDMDANRAYEHYVKGNSPKLDEALGNVQWRERWEKEVRREGFPAFLAKEFAGSMESLHYLPVPLHRMMKVRTDGNVPLYYLALFSRNELAYKFWDQGRKYSTDQSSFRFEEH